MKRVIGGRGVRAGGRHLFHLFCLIFKFSARSYISRISFKTFSLNWERGVLAAEPA